MLLNAARQCDNAEARHQTAATEDDESSRLSSPILIQNPVPELPPPPPPPPPGFFSPVPVPLVSSKSLSFGQMVLPFGLLPFFAFFAFCLVIFCLFVIFCLLPCLFFVFLPLPFWSLSFAFCYNHYTHYKLILIITHYF